MRIILTFLIAFGIGYTVCTYYPPQSLHKAAVATPAPAETPKPTAKSLKLSPLESGAYGNRRSTR